MLIVSQSMHDQMVEDACRAYPRECCGVVLGRRDGDTKTVTEIARVDNTQPEDIQDYFEMDPMQLRDIMERAAATEGIDVLGYYHSHPDHPAKPSPRDLDAASDYFAFAQIRYSYVILACHKGEVVDTTSSVLADDAKSFVQEEYKIS